MHSSRMRSADSLTIGAGGGRFGGGSSSNCCMEQMNK